MAKTRLSKRLALITGLALAICLIPSASASASAPSLLWKTPEDGLPGTGAGRFQHPFGIAVDPSNGHLFVADDNRIDELTAWGEFVKTWGWGVVASGPDNEPAKNEKQSLTVSATAGTYRLTYTNLYRPGDGIFQTTVPIGYNWPASDPGTPGVIDSVEEALQDLPSLKPFPGAVAVSGGPGDGAGNSPYQVEFTGELADKDIPPLEVSSSTLSGGAAETAVATLQQGGSFEICVPASGDVCQAGQGGGNRPGAIFNASGGVAVDGGGNVYVYEDEPEDRGEGYSARVQKFSPAGEFELMVGGDVNKTKAVEPGSTEAERNLCTQAQVEAGDICGTGVPGAGKGQFSSILESDNRIATGPDGLIYVGDAGRIEKLSVAGAFAGELETPEERTLVAMQVDGEGDFYVWFDGIEEVRNEVRKLVAAGEALTESAAFPAVNPKDVALDGAGNLYVIARNRLGTEPGSGPGGAQRVLAYEPDGSVLIANEEHFAELGEFRLSGLATGEGCGIPGVDIYVSDIRGSLSAYGPAPTDIEACPPPSQPPVISRQFASSVEDESATVKAAINPRFWPDTRYYVEYGTGACTAGGCPNTTPAPPGALLSDEVVKQALPTAGVGLPGLAPETTYHYRFVAESSGGGPVYGIDPDAEGPEQPSPAAGLEGTFHTRGEPFDRPSCPNDAFRTGAGARLPDCRAYEMVSPLDKENGDILALEKVQTVPLSLNQASADGEKLTYSSYRAFGDSASAPIAATYLASRTPAGWTSEAISPPRGRNLWTVASAIEMPFKSFTDDLCGSWLIGDTDLPLAPGAPPGYANVYHRQNCGAGAGSYEAGIPAADEAVPPAHFIPEFQGASADGREAIFQAIGALTPEAAPCTVPGNYTSCKAQLYEATAGGPLAFVCLLPNETPAPNGCAAGSPSGDQKKDGRDMMVNNAISDDGSRIFWSDVPSLLGKIYVRIDGALTVPVSAAAEALSGSSRSQYWTAAADGSRAIFSTGGALDSGTSDLYEFAVDEEQTTKIAGKLYGLLGASEDAKRIYLVSGEVLGAGAVANKPNLYIYEAGPGGGFTFIATLADADVNRGDGPLSPVNIVPRHHSAQVAADGMSAAFMSLAPLTGFDNSDAQSGEPAAEVFHYDAHGKQLRCVSCDPTSALPTARDIGNGLELLAARIPVPQTQLYATPKVLAADGSRLYFESYEPLAREDTNGKADVYQWEQAGSGGCEEASPSFDAKAGGCVDLISSGLSVEDSSLVEISASGDDVFFATFESLAAGDPGLVDIYDARVGGGFAPPPTPTAPCEGGACQSPPPPPGEISPGSSSFFGPGNPAAKPAPCPKGKHLAKVKGKKRCVADRHRKSHQKRKQHKSGGKGR